MSACIAAYYEQATRRRTSLGHNDEEQGKSEADQLAVQLRENDRPSVEQDITIHTAL